MTAVVNLDPWQVQGIPMPPPSHSSKTIQPVKVFVLPGLSSQGYMNTVLVNCKDFLLHYLNLITPLSRPVLLTLVKICVCCVARAKKKKEKEKARDAQLMMMMHILRP